VFVTLDRDVQPAAGSPVETEKTMEAVLVRRQVITRGATSVARHRVAVDQGASIQQARLDQLAAAGSLPREQCHQDSGAGEQCRGVVDWRSANVDRSAAIATLGRLHARECASQRVAARSGGVWTAHAEGGDLAVDQPLIAVTEVGPAEPQSFSHAWTHVVH